MFEKLIPNEKVRKVVVGTLLAGAGAAVAVVAESASGGAFGVYSPIVGAVASVLLNAVRKAVVA